MKYMTYLSIIIINKLIEILNNYQIINCNNTHYTNLLSNKIIKLDDLW